MGSPHLDFNQWWKLGARLLLVELCAGANFAWKRFRFNAGSGFVKLLCVYELNGKETNLRKYVRIGANLCLVAWLAPRTRTGRGKIRENQRPEHEG